MLQFRTSGPSVDSLSDQILLAYILPLISLAGSRLSWLLFGLLGLCRRPWPSGGVDSLLLGNSAEISGFGESPPVLAFLDSMVRVAGRKKGSCVSEVDFVGGIRGNSLLGVNSALLESS